jgi:hypothetical protein
VAILRLNFGGHIPRNDPAYLGQDCPAGFPIAFAPA